MPQTYKSTFLDDVLTIVMRGQSEPWQDGDPAGGFPVEEIYGSVAGFLVLNTRENKRWNLINMRITPIISSQPRTSMSVLEKLFLIIRKVNHPY